MKLYVVAVCALLGTLLAGCEDSVEKEVTYREVHQLIDKNCLWCHSGPKPDGDLLLESYDQVKDAYLHHNLMERINDRKEPMPETGLIRRSSRAKFEAWEDSGFLK